MCVRGIFCVCVCECTLYRTKAKRHCSQLPLPPFYQASHQTLPHLVMLSPWAMRQERKLDKQPAPGLLSLSSSSPPLPLSLSTVGFHDLALSPSSSFPPLSRLASTICGSWVDECRGMKRDWKTVPLSHNNWSKKLGLCLNACSAFSLCFSLSQCLPSPITVSIYLVQSAPFYNQSVFLSPFYVPVLLYFLFPAFFKWMDKM